MVIKGKFNFLHVLVLLYVFMGYKGSICDGMRYKGYTCDEMRYKVSGCDEICSMKCENISGRYKFLNQSVEFKLIGFNARTW